MQGSHDSRHRGWRSALSHFVQHIRDDWPATIFVAAFMAFLESQFGWLDAINGHAFVAIGNVAGIPQTIEKDKAKALVVLIDGVAAESRYLDRSPLDRCQLKDDIGAVYSAMANVNQKRAPAQRLDLMVIDIDLSPARWLASDPGSKTPEADCERKLHQEIIDADTKHQIRTVLMLPFESSAARVNEVPTTWRNLESTVTFGLAGLPVEYGLVIKQYCDPNTLAASAYALSAKLKDSRRNCIDEATRHSKRNAELIDPRKYLSGVVPIAVGSAADLSKRIELKLTADQLSDTAANPADFKAVFFGAAFGEGDTFVTPLGELYGVEIHAAAFLSLLDPLSTNNHLSEFLADIVFGFLFGFLIAYCWERYFKLRLSQDSDHRLSAPLWLVVLGVAVIIMAILLTFVSLLLLARFGIWASPIPMAVGMLVESFVSGSVAEGIRTADAIKGVGKPPRRSFRESAKMFFGGDFYLLLKKSKPWSATLVAFRLVVWMAVVIFALLH
jgi:hypothetical protein